MIFSRLLPLPISFVVNVNVPLGMNNPVALASTAPLRRWLSSPREGPGRNKKVVSSWPTAPVLDSQGFCRHGKMVAGIGEERREGRESRGQYFQEPSRLSFLFHRKSDDDSWVSNGTYLELRKDLGFSQLDHPILW